MKQRTLLFAFMLLVVLFSLTACNNAQQEQKDTSTTDAVAQEGSMPVKHYPGEVARWNAVELLEKYKWIDPAAKVVDDSEADKGRCVVWYGANGKPSNIGCLTWGPFVQLLPRKYQVTFRLKTNKTEFDDTNAISADVIITYSSSGKNEVLGNIILKGSSFTAGKWSDRYTIKLDVKEEGTAEIHVLPTTAADTYLDYIVLSEI